MEKLLELGSHYASDFIKKGENYLDRPKFSLDLILDERLGAARLAELTPTEVMFGKYWYSSRINEGMVSQLKDIVDEVSSRVKHEVGDVWLDIAANDGTLLKMVPNSFTKVGIDPADDTFLAESSKVATMVQDFFSVDAYNRSGFGNKKAKVITTIAMFYDLENPDSFVKDIIEILDDNGVWVIQMSYTPLMIKQLAFDNTCFKSDTFILGANKYIDSVNIGDKVIDQNGGFSEVTKTFERDYDGPMIKIKPKFLNWIEATPEHPILVVKKSNLETLNREWCSIKDIESGDFVVVPRIKTYPINRFVDLSKYNNTDSPNYRRGLKSIYLTDDVLWMLGLFVAEGHIGGVPTNLQIEFTLHQKEHYYYDRITSIFKSLGYKTRVRPSKLSKAVNVQVSCTALANMLIEWFGRGARNKRIPDFLFTAESDVIIPFLNGLIDGDGSIDCNGQVSLHLSSRTLIEQVQLMLANLDSILGFSYVKPYASMLNGHVVKGGDSWQLRRKHVNLDQIFNTQHNRVRKEQKFPTDNKYLYLPVQKIESNNFTGKVYNIETSSNTYLVSNAVVHNCGEHVYYYSLNSIKKLIEPHSLKIVDCSINHTNGGSFRVSMQKTCADPNSFANQPVRDCCDVRIESLLNWERTCCDISNPDLWYQFQRDIDSLRETVVSFIKSAKAEGKTVAGIGACHDSYTRVVTEDGIKSFKDITKNDLIYSLNPDNGEMELSPIEDIMIYQYSGEMIRFEGQRVNQMVTPNHNVMFSSRSGILKFENAEKFSKRYETKLPFPKWLNGRDDEYFDIREFVDQDLYSRKNTIIPNQFKTADFLYLLGIFIGDGYCSTQGDGWSINLCIPEKDKARKRLQETLERMGLSYRSYSNEIQVASKALYEICLHCGSGALHKRIPKWSLNYSSNYLKYLLDGLVDSDGWYEANRMRFCSSSSLLIKDFVELCFKTGFYPSVSKRRVVKNPKIKEREIISKTGYIVNINKTIPNFKRSKIVNYDGEVWCLSVKNKNFLVERDGKFAFSGNSTKGNTLLQYFGLDSTLIDFISERSPAKHGLYTIGTNIPIVSEEEARQRKPDYMLLLPWHFVSEIVSREQEYLNGGGKFIVPMPKFTIISK